MAVLSFAIICQKNEVQYINGVRVIRLFNTLVINTRVVLLKVIVDYGFYGLITRVWIMATRVRDSVRDTTLATSNSSTPVASTRR